MITRPGFGERRPCARRAPLGGMVPDPYAGTELGYDSYRLAAADPFLHWCYTHFCTHAAGVRSVCGP